MTVTVKGGSEDASRKIGAYQTSLSWTENQVTWKLRRTGDKWSTPGGDYGTKLDEATVSNKAGTKVTFDVTPAGEGCRRRRARVVALYPHRPDRSRELDVGIVPRVRRAQRSRTSPSRPVLKVTYGGSTTAPPPPPPPPPSGSTLRVLHWNTHHGGVGSDGVWDPDRLDDLGREVQPGHRVVERGREEDELEQEHRRAGDARSR